MLNIDRSGSITKWIDGRTKKIEFNDIEEKEILLDIATKLASIRGMLAFFTTLTVLGIIVGIILIIRIGSRTQGF